MSMSPLGPAGLYLFIILSDFMRSLCVAEEEDAYMQDMSDLYRLLQLGRQPQRRGGDQRGRTRTHVQHAVVRRGRDQLQLRHDLIRRFVHFQRAYVIGRNDAPHHVRVPRLHVGVWGLSVLGSFGDEARGVLDDDTAVPHPLFHLHAASSTAQQEAHQGRVVPRSAMWEQGVHAPPGRRVGSRATQTR
jgi:hypothetical protein